MGNSDPGPDGNKPVLSVLREKTAQELSADLKEASNTARSHG